LGGKLIGLGLQGIGAGATLAGRGLGWAAGFSDDLLSGAGKGLGRGAQVGTEVSARTPVGRRGGGKLSLPNITTRNSSGIVNGRKYTGHAFDRMQQRGLGPLVVENAIQTGIRSPGKYPGTTRIWDAINDVVVVINASGDVITAY